jgi:hypothetical protein
VNGTFQVTQKVTDANSLFDTEVITIKVVSKPLITTVMPLPSLVQGVRVQRGLAGMLTWRSAGIAFPGHQ